MVVGTKGKAFEVVHRLSAGIFSDSMLLYNRLDLFKANKER